MEIRTPALALALLFVASPAHSDVPNCYNSVTRHTDMETISTLANSPGHELQYCAIQQLVDHYMARPDDDNLHRAIEWSIIAGLVHGEPVMIGKLLQRFQTRRATTQPYRYRPDEIAAARFYQQLWPQYRAGTNLLRTAQNQDFADSEPSYQRLVDHIIDWHQYYGVSK